ncbi:MAG: hypothetical protein KJ737_18745 [Proteobacteria bacterium]|nr:hypothetical protein [Pseudomonadota bacterium]
MQNEVRTDIKKNRLYITMKNMSNVEMESLIVKLDAECTKLEKGFSCLNDITDYDPSSLESESLLVKAQKKLWLAGLGVIVNISRNEKLEGHYQLEKASKMAVGYSAAVVSSPKEAEDILDGKKMRDQVCLAVKQGTLERFSRLAAFRKEDTLEFIESVLMRYLEDQKKKQQENEDPGNDEIEPESFMKDSIKRRSNDQLAPLLIDKIDRLTGICERMAMAMEKLESR